MKGYKPPTSNLQSRILKEIQNRVSYGSIPTQVIVLSLSEMGTVLATHTELKG